MSAGEDSNPLIALDERPNEGTESPNGSNPVSPSPAIVLPCEMCQNYETNLKNTQETERKLREELKAIRANAERFEADLAQERQYRHDLERKMTQKAAEAEEQLNESTRIMEKLTLKLDDAIASSDRARLETHNQLTMALEKLQQQETENETLSKKFLKLLGLNRESAASMRDAPIDMPTDVDQLQYTCLKLREELIESKAAREYNERDYRDELTALSEQIGEEKKLRISREGEFSAEISQLQTELAVSKSEVHRVSQAAEQVEVQARQIKELQETVAELEGMVQQKQSECASLEQTASNWKARSMTLQRDLDTSESVQKDFVKLSQDLQIQLEKIRQSDQEIRFQWEDEVAECSSPGCSASVTRLKPKPRCYHCGKIFCAACVATTVPAGRNARPTPVCPVCHTLLNKTSAPFFSREGKA